jgi:enamine deaminase RidA (YjgF/YER057c/UK114 family)
LKNIQIVLRAAGCSKPSGGLSNIIKANVFLTDMKDFSALNGAWVEVLTAAQKEDGIIGEGQEAVMPARTCVQVAALPFGTDVSTQRVSMISSSHRTVMAPCLFWQSSNWPTLDVLPMLTVCTEGRDRMYRTSRLACLKPMIEEPRFLRSVCSAPTFCASHHVVLRNGVASGLLAVSESHSENGHSQSNVTCPVAHSNKHRFLALDSHALYISLPQFLLDNQPQIDRNENAEALHFDEVYLIGE